LTLLANFLAKEHTFYWKDISEIKAITGSVARRSG
jgi:hypothetical protein